MVKWFLNVPYCIGYRTQLHSFKWYLPAISHKKNRTSKWPWSSESTFYAGVRHRLHIQALEPLDSRDSHTSAHIQHTHTHGGTHTHTTRIAATSVCNLYATSQIHRIESCSPCVQNVLNRKGNIARNECTKKNTHLLHYFFRYRSRIDSVWRYSSKCAYTYRSEMVRFYSRARHADVCVTHRDTTQPFWGSCDHCIGMAKNWIGQKQCIIYKS